MELTETQKLANLLGPAYQVEEKISEHQGSVLIKASDREGRSVAVKIAKNRTSAAGLKSEAEILMQLKHPNIVGLIKDGTNSDPAFIVLEYLDGQMFAEMVPSPQGLPWQNMEPIFLQLCDAIETAHDFGVFHLDLKPTNIFLARGTLEADVVKVIDFGIALNSLGNHPSRTNSLGTPGFAAPEQILRNQAETVPDHRADIYALGAILGFLLSGSRLFEGREKDVILKNQLHEKITIPQGSELAQESGVRTIVQKCLSFDPRDRYQNVAELSDDVVATL